MARRLGAWLLTSSAAVLFATGVLAQPASPSPTAPPPDPEANVVGEVIVTASRRETSLQTTALAISAVSGEALQTQQVTNIEGLAQSLPSVNFGQTTGNARIAIRGVGFDNISLGNEGRVAYHVDGVYISRPSAALASFYDVQRVEVLRGPQGTLYGRNATGGAVNVITRAPGDTASGFIEATVGNYGLFRLEGAAGGPISDSLSGRVAFQVIEREGYGENLTNGLDVDDQSTRGIRGSVRYRPNERFDLTLNGDFFTQDDHAYSFHYLRPGSIPDPTTTPPLPGLVPRGLRVGGRVPTDLRDSTSDSGPQNDREFYGVSANLVVDFGWSELTSITAARSNAFATVTDLDATSAPLSIYDQLEESDTFSQELRLTGEYSRGDWLIGAYYFSEDLLGGTRIALDPLVFAPVNSVLPPPSGYRTGFYAVGTLDTEAVALFGNLRFQFTDQLAIRLGARYSDETKDIDEAFRVDAVTPFPGFFPRFPPPSPPFNRRQTSENWSSFTPSVTLEYEATDDLFGYLTYSQGFKSGGFNLGNVQAPFDPEEITSYEAGVRADWMGGRLRTNVSAFLYDYANLQVSKVNGALVTIDNAAEAEVYGLEAEVVLLVGDNLRLDSTLSLLNTQYKEYTTTDPARALLGVIDLEGNDLTQSPSYTVNLNATYTVPLEGGELILRGESRFVDNIFFTQFNLDHVRQESYSLFNAFVTYERDNGFYATAFMRNIGNEDIVSAALVSSSLVGSPLVGSFEPPRTFGVTVGYRF